MAESKPLAQQSTFQPPLPEVVLPGQRLPDDGGFSILKTVVRGFKVAGMAAGVWTWGYFGFSVAWMYVALFFYVAGEECRKIKDSKKAYAKQAVLSEKEAIMSRVEEKPTWVHFQDVEKAEWFNKIVKQMWPYIGEYVQNLLLSNIQQTIQGSLPNKFNNFRFESIDMGDTPPRIDGVKVYMEQVQKDEIICDVEFRYSGDAKFKISVNSVIAGIKSLSITGTMRVIMKPLVTDVPIIGAMSFFFLNRPTVNFDLTAAANILDIPLLRKSLRTIVEEQIAYYLVLPNRLPIELVSGIDVHKLRHPLPQGVVHLHVVEGRDLKAADSKLLGKKSSDPYCIIRVGANEYKSKTIKSTLNPTWDHHFELIIDQKFGQRIDIVVRDSDISNDEFLGRASLSLETVAKTGTVNVWQQLEGVKTGRVHVRLVWLHLCKDIDEMRQRRSIVMKMPVNNNQILSSAVLVLLLEEVTNLPKPRNIYAMVEVCQKQCRSSVQMKTTNPHWGENFQFLVDDPETRYITIELWHNPSKSKKLGAVRIPINVVLTEEKLTAVKTFPVVAVADPMPDCMITVRLTLRILSSELPANWYTDSVQTLTSMMDLNGSQANISTTDGLAPDDEYAVRKSTVEMVSAAPPRMKRFGQIRLTIQYVKQYSQLVVIVHECRDLIPCDKDNLADPYVRIFILPDHSNVTKKRTKMVKNNLNPSYDEKFEWPMSMVDAGVRAIDIAVKNDVTLFSKSRTSMGRVVIGLSTLRDLTRPTTEWYDLVEAKVN